MPSLAWITVAVVANAGVWLLTRAVNVTGSDDEPSSGVEIATWLLLTLPAITAVWVWLARPTQGSEPPWAYRIAFHLGGLAVTLLGVTVTVSHTASGPYPNHLRALITVVVIAAAVQFLTAGRLLNLWIRRPDLHDDVGGFIVQISTHWAIVATLLATALLRAETDDLATDAVVAASVLTLPYVAHVHWRVRRWLGAAPLASGASAPFPERPHEPRWVLGGLFAAVILIRLITGRPRRSRP